MRTSPAESATHCLGLAGETIRSLLSSTKMSALRLEVLHGHGRQVGGIMVPRLILMHLMDLVGCVHNMWLDCLLPNHRLDRLMDMTMDVLANNDARVAARVLRLTNLLHVLKLCLLSFEALLHMAVIAVFDVAVLEGAKAVGVLLGLDFFVVDGLHGHVVVVLVHFVVDGCLGVFVVRVSYVPVVDGGVNFLLFISSYFLG